MIDYVALSYWDVALSAVFLLINGLLSIALNLKVERQLFLAAARMVAQLLLVGLVLKVIFAAASIWLTILAAAIMIGFAAREIWARQERRFTGVWGFGIGGGMMVAAGLIITPLALTTMIEPDPWWSPRFALPLAGMILGNAMTGVSLGLDTLTTAFQRERSAIEAQLLLGRSFWQAVTPFVRRALRSGFMPIINAMAATGVVALPGMMTGQILSGVDPNEAVKYQILIMFLIGGATGLGVLGAVVAGVWRLTDSRQRLRLDRLRAPR